MNDEEKQSQIDAVIAQFKADAKSSRARQFQKPIDDKMRPLKKRLKEIEVDHDYCGEGSPYWDFLSESQDNGDGMSVMEDAIANPDVLPEEGSVHHRPLTSEGDLQSEAMQIVWPTLSPQQQTVMQLMFDGVWVETKDENGQIHGARIHTLEAIAETLGITHQAVSGLFERIKTKIRRQYEKLKAEGL